MGDEFLFQELAGTNVEVLQRYDVKKIITHCPHCLNSLAQDYPQFGGDYEVVHHSVFLSQLIMDGKLEVDPAKAGIVAGKITYHDPCYLARVGGTTEEPRGLIGAAGELEEMPRRRQATACCGAGGGRMWFDDEVGARVGRGRVDEALATGADTVAVACPFCLTMMSDGIDAKGGAPKVQDVAELLALAIDQGG